MPNPQYPLAVRAAVLADVLTVGINEASKKSGVSVRTINRWLESEGSFPRIFVKQANSLMLKTIAKLYQAVETMDVSDPQAVTVLLQIAKLMGEMSLHYDNIQATEEETEEEETIYIEV